MSKSDNKALDSDKRPLVVARKSEGSSFGERPTTARELGAVRIQSVPLSVPLAPGQKGRAFHEASRVDAGCQSVSERQALMDPKKSHRHGRREAAAEAEVSTSPGGAGEAQSTTARQAPGRDRSVTPQPKRGRRETSPDEKAAAEVANATARSRAGDAQPSTKPPLPASVYWSVGTTGRGDQRSAGTTSEIGRHHRARPQDGAAPARAAADREALMQGDEPTQPASSGSRVCGAGADGSVAPTVVPPVVNDGVSIFPPPDFLHLRQIIPYVWTTLSAGNAP